MTPGEGDRALLCTMQAVVMGFIGNERAVSLVSASLKLAPPAQAYLFSGPERVGKATLAATLAQALNCAAGDAPCGLCATCRRIAAGIHADVQTVTVEAGAESPQRKAISVEQIRDVGSAAALSPFEGRTRVVILDPADEMTPPAQNAFLKTLEEPPPHVVFVLVATQEERLLETVRSRCRRVEFRLAPAAAIAAALRERGLDEARAQLLAHLSRGRAGWALEMAADAALLERRRERLAEARSLGDTPVAERLALAERLMEEFRREREPVLARLSEWQSWWRDVLLMQCGAAEGVENVDALADLEADAARYARRDVAAFAQALGDAAQHLRENVQPRLALPGLLLVAPLSGEPALVRQGERPRSV